VVTDSHIVKPTGYISTIANAMSGELRFCLTKFQEVQENEDCIPLWQPLRYCTINVFLTNAQCEPSKPQLVVTASCFTTSHYREGCPYLCNFPSTVPDCQ